MRGTTIADENHPAAIRPDVATNRGAQAVVRTTCKQPKEFERKHDGGDGGQHLRGDRHPVHETGDGARYRTKRIFVEC